MLREGRRRSRRRRGRRRPRTLRRCRSRGRCRRGCRLRLLLCPATGGIFHSDLHLHPGSHGRRRGGPGGCFESAGFCRGRLRRCLLRRRLLLSSVQQHWPHHIEARKGARPEERRHAQKRRKNPSRPSSKPHPNAPKALFHAIPGPNSSAIRAARHSSTEPSREQHGGGSASLSRSPRLFRLPRTSPPEPPMPVVAGTGGTPASRVCV